MKSIYLIGFMGAGKTTIGKELGNYLNLHVIDTDEEIEKREQLTVSEIFEQKSEAYFRTMETKILQELSAENAVITTGGGIISKLENRTFLKEKGQVFFLYATEDEIAKRLEKDESRPLLKGDKKTKIQALYKDRLPLYKETADNIIDTTGKEIEEVIKEIVACIKLVK